MRKALLTLTLLLIVHSFASANTYYVAVNGNDSNVGTISNPWGTWQKAFNTANAGDTVYFRGGIWYPTTYTDGNAITIIAPHTSFIWSGNIYGNDGTVNNPICFFNYPGEVPILDCSLVDITGHQYNVGLSIYNADFIHFKGLTINNVRQPTTPNSIGDHSPAAGVGITATTNLTFENFTIENIGGRGFGGSSLLGYHTDPGYDTTRFINVDVHDCNDALSEVPGNSADAYKLTLQSYSVSEEDNPNGKLPVYILSGCRSWNVTDDGSDIGGVGIVRYEKCWFFSNGNDNSIDGNGLKIGGVFDSINATIPLRLVTNCIMANNRGTGIYDLQYEPYFQNNSRVYNNFVYHNAVGMQNGLANRYTVINSAYRNNIIYGSTDIDAAGRPQNFIVDKYYTESNNSFKYWAESGSLFRWQPNEAVTVTDDDFLSLDGTQLLLPRKADGSLPDITFGRLAPTSDLIDKGIDVGLPYNGSAPDIGAFEFVNSSGLSKTSTNNLRFTISPTLVDEEALFQFTGINQGVFHFEIYNISGVKVLETESAQIIPGTNTIRINLIAFKHGFYLCRLMCNKQITSTLKFVKK